MNKSIGFLLVAQFLTAFADRALLFILIVLIGTLELAAWNKPVIQIAFILAYVFFAPLAGAYSDSHHKRNVLLKGNVIKLVGVACIFFFMIPVLQQWALLLGYFIVGVGAVIFSPAKYGLLPELVEEKKLVQVNSWLEGTTILAILIGQIAGASLGQQGIILALIVVIIIYAVSAMLSYGVELTPIRGRESSNTFIEFKQDMFSLLKSDYARFSLLSVSMFWAIAAVLQLLLFEWSALVLGITDEVEISTFGLAISIGIIIGALVVPLVIKLNTLRRVRFPAFIMGIFVVLLSMASTVNMTYLVLVCVGVCGGMLVVPINAALEDIGHHSVGSGGAVAVQRFFENTSMAVGLVVYTLVLALGIPADTIMFALGVIIILMTMYITFKLPKKPLTPDHSR